MKLGIALALAAAAGLAQDFDILIRNGRVVDGAGNAWFRADVGVKDRRIAAVGALAGKTATRVIDAAGRIVAPGIGSRQ